MARSRAKAHARQLLQESEVEGGGPTVGPMSPDATVLSAN